MERLRRELSHLLGEKLSRLECVSEAPDSVLWALYDSQGHPLPLLAKCFSSPGVAARCGLKMSQLARHGSVRLPVVYGVITHDDRVGQELLLMERLRGVPVEAPARTPERWTHLKDQIVEALLSWHRVDSGGYVGDIDSIQHNRWSDWYRQRVEVLWSTLGQFTSTGLSMQDMRTLWRARAALATLLSDADDVAVMVHGNLTLRSLLKDARSDQLIAAINPGVTLWAPREYELFRLWEEGMPESLLWHYLKRAPVAESFLWRRWLYLLWSEVARLVTCGHINRPAFDRAARELLPWLS